MTKNVRDGLALVCVALVCLLLGAVSEVRLLFGAGVLCAIGGLALVAFGLLRDRPLRD